jgi:hypothetical protein
MKNVMILVLVLIAASFSFADTPANEIIAVRSAVDTCDVAITTFGYNSWPATAVPWPKEYNTAIFEFYAVGSENVAIPYKIYVKWLKYGHIQLVADGNATTGSMAVVTNPVTGDAITAKWCDTITNTIDDIWPGGVDIFDIANNRICMLVISKWPGVAKVYVEFSAMPANTTVYCIMIGG